MKGLYRLLFILGYVLFVGPPRALDIAVSERRNGGELASIPVWGVLVVEGMLRIVLFLIVAVVVEQLITPYWYSWLEIDRSAGVILAIGLLHMTGYYLILHRMRRVLGVKAFRIYRLLRNIGYAFLPGLAAVTLGLLYDSQAAVQVFTEHRQLIVYGAVTSVMLIVGSAEALFVSRLPQGLDQYLKERASA